MKENNYSIWKKANIYNGKYDICSIVDTPEGLEIELREMNSDTKLLLVYDSFVCAYQSVEEGFWINELEQQVARYGLEFITNNTFFEVENSTYAQTISKGSNGTIDVTHLFHLCIVSANSTLDIVSFKEPIIMDKFE